MEESENRIVLSEPGPSSWPHKTTMLTPVFFLLTLVFLCPPAVLLFPSPSLFQGHPCSQAPCLHALVHGISARAALFHRISRCTLMADSTLSWEEDSTGRCCGDAIARQEPCSQRELFTKGARGSSLGCGDWRCASLVELLREVCAG